MDNDLEKYLDFEEKNNLIKKIKQKKSNVYFMELKIVTENLKEIQRLIEWSNFLGFYSDGIIQEENGIYWTFLNINNNLIFANNYKKNKL